MPRSLLRCHVGELLHNEIDTGELIIIMPIILCSFLFYNLGKEFSRITRINKQDGVFSCEEKELMFTDVTAILLYVDINKAAISKGLSSVSIYFKEKNDLLDFEKFVKSDKRFQCRVKQIDFGKLIPF